MPEAITYDAIYIVSNLFSLFIIQKFFCIFFDKSESRGIFTVGTYGLYFALTSALYLTINIPWLTLLVNILCLFLIAMSYKASNKKRIMAVLFTYLFMFFIELFVVIGAGVLKIDITEKASYVSIGAHVILKLITFSAAVCSNSLHGAKAQKAPAHVQFASSIMVASISVYLILTVLNAEGITRMTAVLTASGLFAINVLLFILYDVLANMYDKTMKAALWEKEKEYYFNQCQLMQDSVNEMSAFRHDIGNHLFALKGLLEQSDEQVLRYISILDEKTQITNEYSRSGNVAIDSFVNYKLRNAESLGVETVVEIAVPKDLNMDIADVVTILGNLIDNAIEALQTVDENRKLFLKMIFTKGRVILSVKNRFCGLVIYQNGRIVSSKQANGHGYGLKNIEDVVKKYDGKTSIHHEGDLFSVDILLYIK